MVRGKLTHWQSGIFVMDLMHLGPFGVLCAKVGTEVLLGVSVKIKQCTAILVQHIAILVQCTGILVQRIAILVLAKTAIHTCATCLLSQVCGTSLSPVYSELLILGLSQTKHA